MPKAARTDPAILLVIQQAEGEPPRVTVAPITHSPPHDPGVAIEIPKRVKRHLGLDSERSWVILDELNVFTWPGYDLRPIPDNRGRYDYGLLPPKFFESIVKKFSELRKERELAHTSRDDEKMTFGTSEQSICPSVSGFSSACGAIGFA